MKQELTNFSKGELGPQLYGRTDTPQYRAGAKRINNFLIQRYGGLSFRPGFRFAAEAATDDMRYIPFQFNIEQAYVMAFRDEKVRFLALGGMVLEEDLEIISATKETQAILEVNFHAFEVGEDFYISGVTGMTELNGQFVSVVEVIDDSHIRINVDTTNFTTFVSSTGTDRTGAPPAPPAPPTPPPAPPAPPAPPPTGGGGGSGSFLGDFGVDYN